LLINGVLRHCCRLRRVYDDESDQGSGDPQIVALTVHPNGDVADAGGHHGPVMLVPYGK
jgi:hypothetical protein